LISCGHLRVCTMDNTILLILDSTIYLTAVATHGRPVIPTWNEGSFRWLRLFNIEKCEHEVLIKPRFK